MRQNDGFDPRREEVVVSLDSHIVRLLREACGDERAMGEYLDLVIQQRMRVWRHGLRVLEREGWSQSEVRQAEARLKSVFQLEFASATDLTRVLRSSGLRRLGQRLAQNTEMARALHDVLLELQTNNRACARAVALMRPVASTSWWRRVWR